MAEVTAARVGQSGEVGPGRIREGAVVNRDKVGLIEGHDPGMGIDGGDVSVDDDRVSIERDAAHCARLQGSLAHVHGVHRRGRIGGVINADQPGRSHRWAAD